MVTCRQATKATTVPNSKQGDRGRSVHFQAILAACAVAFVIAEFFEVTRAGAVILGGVLGMGAFLTVRIWLRRR